MLGHGKSSCLFVRQACLVCMLVHFWPEVLTNPLAMQDEVWVLACHFRQLTSFDAFVKDL